MIRTGVMLTGLVAFACAATAEPTKLRISLQLPISNHIGANLVAFKTKVEAGTGNAIAIEIIDNARAYDDQTVAKAIQSGAIEMGVVNVTNFSQAVPAIDIFQQPFLFNFEALVRAGTDPARPMRKLVDKAVLDALGTRLLWWQSYGSTVMFSKGLEAGSPPAISEKRIRSFGRTVSEFAKQCGATPVPVAASKQHEAMKTGDVQLVMTGVTGVDSRKLWEVSDTITRTEHAAIEFAVAINESVWQSIDARHREVMAAAALAVEKELREQSQAIEDKAYAFARDKGMRIRELTPDEVAEWRACSAPVMDAFLSSSGELGRQLMALYGQLRVDPCCNQREETGVFSRH